MGQKSRAKAMQRQLRRETTERVAAEFRAAVADPEYQAKTAVLRADAELQALIDRDSGGQVLRLKGDGWRQRYDREDGIGMWDHYGRRARLLHSLDRCPDGEVWAHMSLSHADDTVPGWYEQRNLHWLLYPQIAGYIVVAPQDEHVNIANVMHIWTCLTRPQYLPDFRFLGQI